MMKTVEQLPGPCRYKNRMRIDAMREERVFPTHRILSRFSHSLSSTASSPSDMHGLTPSQLSELQVAVQALDAYLLDCVDDFRNNRWARPNTKHVADCLVRELARIVDYRFQVKPIDDMITLQHRSKLLTRRVRAVLREFSKNHNYLSETPNIIWDDSFVPPELYDDRGTEPKTLDTKGRQVEGNLRESQTLKIEKQMPKEKANTMKNDRGKANNTAQDKESFEEIEKRKRKWTRNTFETILNKDGTSSDESEPLAKRVNRKESIDNVGVIPVPPPCRRCTISQMECKPNGWHACKTCRKAQQTCSLSKALPNDNKNDIDLVKWLSPRHSITDEDWRNCVFDICQLIAQKSDDGRQALVGADILPKLSHLASSRKAIEVVSACQILKALAHTGTLRNAIISAGLKKVMENITRSTLHSTEEKRLVQASAREVLETLALTKGFDSLAGGQTINVPQKRRHASSLATTITTRRSVSENELPEAEPRLSLQQNVTSPEFSSPASEGRQHMRSLSDSDKHSMLMSEESEAARASNSTTSGNMFSSNNSCFMGGSYYNVQGDAHFSPLFRVSFGFETLHRNISASAFHDSRARFPPPKCHSSTRKDILAKIMNCITETPSSSKILHLFGSEGTGKSAIAQTIAEYCKANGTLGACFFFSRVSLERNTDKSIIATLAYQLCVAVPELKLFISKAVEDDLSTFQKDVDTQMERLIINPIIQATNEGKTLTARYPIVIVIDGLDECEGEKEQCTFLRAISGAIGRYNLPLYFFITSRRERHIVDCLKEDRTLRSTLNLDQNHVQTKEDIEAYICSEFEIIRSVHHVPESFAWPSRANIQTLVSKTNMKFSRASEIMAFIAPSPETRLEIILRTSGPKSMPNREENDGTMISGRVEVDGLRHRRRQNIKSDATNHYYPKLGTKIKITREGFTVVKLEGT